MQLERSAGWEAPKKSADAAALKAAATMFKRGVGFRFDTEPGEVATRSGSYDINFVDAQPTLSNFVIIDGSVQRAWPDVKLPAKHLTLTLDEHGKTLDSIASIIAAWNAAGKPDKWTIVGGGLLSDVASFAAGLVGANVQLVPTTLLAMADASVGGKTGVNFPPFGKNQVGGFYNPTAVTIWSGWLKTLPPREIRAGGIECIKHAFLSGSPVLAQKLAVAIAAGNWSELGAQLPDVVAVKVSIVAEDPGEVARRATLNLGHTLGHALEHISQTKTRGEDTLLHGEAVGIGLVMALMLSVRFGGLKPDTFHTMLGVLKNSGCLPDPVTLARQLGGKRLGHPELFEMALKAMQNDKKADGNKLSTQWILLEDWGKCAKGDSGGWTTSIFTAEVKRAYGEIASTYEKLTGRP